MFLYSGVVKGAFFLRSGGLYFLSLGRNVRQLLFWMYFSRGNHHKSVRLRWLRYFSPFQISYCSFHVYCFLYASLIASFEALWDILILSKEGRCETLYYSASYFDLKLRVSPMEENNKTTVLEEGKNTGRWIGTCFTGEWKKKKDIGHNNQRRRSWVTLR